MPTRVKHSDQRHDWWLVEAVCNIIGVALIILNVIVECRCTISDGNRSTTSLVSVRTKGVGGL